MIIIKIHVTQAECVLFRLLVCVFQFDDFSATPDKTKKDVDLKFGTHSTTPYRKTYQNPRDAGGVCSILFSRYICVMIELSATL